MPGSWRPAQEALSQRPGPATMYVVKRACALWSFLLSSVTPAHLKGRALDDAQNEARETVILRREPPRDLPYGRTVVRLEPAAQGIREHLFGEAFGKSGPVGF